MLRCLSDCFLFPRHFLPSFINHSGIMHKLSVGGEIPHAKSAWRRCDATNISWGEAALSCCVPWLVTWLTRRLVAVPPRGESRDPAQRRSVGYADQMDGTHRQQVLQEGAGGAKQRDQAIRNWWRWVWVLIPLELTRRTLPIHVAMWTPLQEVMYRWVYVLSTTKRSLKPPREIIITHVQ